MTRRLGPHLLNRLGRVALSDLRQRLIDSEKAEQRLARGQTLPTLQLQRRAFLPLHLRQATRGESTAPGEKYGDMKINRSVNVYVPKMSVWVCPTSSESIVFKLPSFSYASEK